MYSYSILAALLVLSFGLTSAFADDTFVDPENLVFGASSQPYLPRPTSSFISDPLTGEPITYDSSKNYFLYTTNQGPNIESDEKQLVQLHDEEFYLVPDPQDRTANTIAVLLLAVPFGLLVYRLSDEDPIPVKYAKLSGVVVAFSMLSMLSMPITIGNSFWGYASASTNSNVNIPTPVYSLYFDNDEGFSANDAVVILDQKNSALSLDGINDYIVLDDSLSEKLDSFTVSAWVKPDYKKGSADILSVASGVDSFDLSINNNVGKHVAIFSVYDGMKWHSVSSHTAIPEQWTHISATYSDGTIKIFVNGIQENSKNVADSYSKSYQIAESTQNIHPYISLKSNVLVGAFNPSIREEATLENHFTGLIDDVTLYDKLLSSDQISALDENNRTPDVIQKEIQSVQTQQEQTGTANEYGFVTSDDNLNDQKIEEVAAEGYKVKKPEEKKKKDKAVTEQTPETTEETPEVTKESPETVTAFDESVTLVVTSSTTTVCHIPPGKGGQNKTLTIGESALDAHLRHGDVQPTCENPINPSNVVIQAPESETFVAESNSLSAKLVRVSADTTATFTDLPAINSKLDYQWKLYGNVDGEMRDYTNDPNVNLLLLDLDSDKTLDRAEWSTTEGVTEYYLVAKIILATDGLHLDSNRDYVDDIFYEIKEQDGIWSYPIPVGDYVRVTFEQPLALHNDISVFAKSLGNSTIEVYEKDGTVLLATFEPIDSISSPGFFHIFLGNLVGEQDTFDLKIVGSPIQFDLIKDPAQSVEQCKNGGIGKPARSCHDMGGNDDNWVTGNVNGQKSHWAEGDFLPYRAIVTGVDEPGTWTSLYAFDTAKQSERKHAIDYLGSYNHTEPTGAGDSIHLGFNNPCSDIFSCDPFNPADFEPMEVPLGLTTSYPNTECADGTFSGSPILGNLYGWITPGATLDIDDFYYTSPSGTVVDPDSTDCPAEFAIDYTVGGTLNNTVTVIFAWGGHVAANEDPIGGNWSIPNAIPTGSPYHMRVGDIYSPISGFTNIGQQELQLSATAIIRPSQIIVEKTTIPTDSPQVFKFTTGGIDYNDFDLMDGESDKQEVETNLKITGNANNPNFGLLSGKQLFSVSEDPVPGWTLTNVTCVGVGGTYDIHNSTNLGNPDPDGFLIDSGETIICEFENTQDGMLKIIKETIGDNGTFSFVSNSTALGTNFDIFVNNTNMGMTDKVNVTAGIYNVTEVVPPGWILVDSFCDDASETSAINISPGEFVTCTFVNEAQVAIHGLKYHDLNANGDQDDGEPPLEDWTIFNDTNSNGIFDNGELNTTTNNDGEYWFMNIPMGNYKICEQLEPEWIQSEPADPECYDITLSAGNSAFNKDFGNYVNGSLHLVAFDDLNADGYQNQNDPLWNGTFIQKKIDLFNSTDETLIESQFIDESGEAWFVNLMPGNYTLQEDISIFNLTQVMPSPDPDGVGPIPGGADMRNFTITSGQEYAWEEGAAMLGQNSNKTEIVVENQKLSFGNFIKGSLHIFAFEDKDMDGYLNQTDDAWNGTIIQKKIDLSYANGTFIESQFVDEFGEAWYVNLMPGNYTLQEDVNFLPDDVMPSPDPDGPEGIPGGGDARNVTITSGQELAWEEGAAMLGQNSNKTEVVVDDGRLIFGNFIKQAWLKIIKNATSTAVFSNHEIEFTFDINGTSQSVLSLNSTHRMNNTLPSEVPIGNYNVTELALLPGWILKDSECNIYESTDGTQGNFKRTELDTHDFTLDSLELAECYFTNDNTAFINLTKTTTNPTDKNETFNFNATLQNGTEIFQSLTVLATSSSTTLSELIQVPAGNTTINEINLPAGWKDTMTGTCDVVTYNEQLEEQDRDQDVGLGPIDLLPWQSLECEFVNDNTAFLKIIKNTTENSPDVIDNIFNFTYVGPSGVNHTSINVTAGSHSNMTEIFTIPAGNYNVTEDIIDNWVLQSSKCTVYETNDGETPGDVVGVYEGSQTENFTLQPWELAICEFVNNNPVGYFTGGGRVNLNETSPTHNADISILYAGEIIDKVTHGFQLHCDSNSGPNNLEVNWLGFQFHLEQLENALCYDDGTVNEPPAQTDGNPNSRKPTLDVYYGEGYGRYDGQCGAYAKWVMDDNGEPGKIDQIVSMVIWDKDGDLVLNINPDQLGVKDTSISGNWTSNQNIPDDGEEWLDLEIGNHQWTPHPFKSHGPTHTTPCDPIDQSFNATGIFENPLG